MALHHNFRAPLLTAVCSALMLVTCQAQEAPTLNAEQFSDVTYRNDVCERFQKYASGEVDIRDSLRGLELAVGVVDHNDDLYFNFTADGTIDEKNPGIFVEILDKLAGEAGFTWRNSYGRILPPSNTSRPDSTWTDVLVDSVERFDLSFAEWVHTQERRNLGVHFPVGWYDTSTIFIRDSREGITNDFNFSSWTRPLDWTLWLLYALGFLYNRVLFWLLDKLEDDGSPKLITSKEKSFRIRMVELVFDADRSNGKRLHNMSASLFAMVFVSSLTANLAGFLIQQSEPDFEYISLEDLNSRFIPVCVREGDAVFETLSRDFETMNFIRSTESVESYERLLRGECEVVAARAADFDRFARDPTANPDCTLEWVGRPEYINFGGMATLVDMNDRCTSLVGHVLDLYLHELTDKVNFLNPAWEEYLQAFSTYKCEDKKELEDTRYSLTLNDIGGIFIVYGCLAIFGLLVAIVEQYFERRKVRKALEAEERVKKNDLDLSETDKGKSSHVNMLGEVSGHVNKENQIEVDPDVLKRILHIDRTLAKLQYQITGEKRPSRGPGGGLSRSFSNRSFRSMGSDSLRKRLSSSSRDSGDGGTVSPRNSGTATGRMSFDRKRPSLSELGKPKSQQNILAMG